MADNDTDSRFEENSARLKFWFIDHIQKNLPVGYMYITLDDTEKDKIVMIYSQIRNNYTKPRFGENGVVLKSWFIHHILKNLPVEYILKFDIFITLENMEKDELVIMSSKISNNFQENIYIVESYKIEKRDLKQTNEKENKTSLLELKMSIDEINNRLDKMNNRLDKMNSSVIKINGF